MRPKCHECVLLLGGILSNDNPKCSPNQKRDDGSESGKNINNKHNPLHVTGHLPIQISTASNLSKAQCTKLAALPNQLFRRKPKSLGKNRHRIGSNSPVERMRFHPLALSIAVGALGSSDAFVLPKATVAESRATTRMDAANNGGYLDANGSKKPNSRIEKQRAQLQADVDAAEQLRLRTAQQLADADAARKALEKEAEKAAKEAEAMEAKFNSFEAKQAARLAAGGSLGGVVGPVVGGGAIIGGLVVGREQLAARMEKAEEERFRREEAERQAEEAARRRAAQEAQSQNLLPIVGAGVAGLGAFGALLNSQGGDGTVVDAVDKIC